MTPEEETLAEIRAHINELNPATRVKVERIAHVIRAIVDIDEGYGSLALALVGAEAAVQS